MENGVASSAKKVCPSVDSGELSVPNNEENHSNKAPPLPPAPPNPPPLPTRPEEVSEEAFLIQITKAMRLGFQGEFHSSRHQLKCSFAKV